MSVKLQREVKLLGQTAFQALRHIDAKSPHGLCGCVEISPHAGKRRKEEAVMTTFITERLKKKWTVEQTVRRYPTSRKLCDRVVELSDGSLLWLEIKLAWKSWYYDEVYVNSDFFYKGYFGGAHHSHSVSGDFDKMETISAPFGSYAGFLLIGFDDKAGTLLNDIQQLITSKQLGKKKWRFLPVEAWKSKGSDQCWHRCWFAYRRL